MRKIILFSPHGYIGTYMKEAIQREKEVKLYEIIRDSDLTKYKENYDVMIYSAAVSDANVEKYIQDNVVTVLAMINFCRKHQVRRIIYLSTDSIYGRINTDMVSEKAVMIEPDLYGITKYLAEKIIIESEVPYYILRMPSVVGRIQRKNFISNLLYRIKNNESIELYNIEREFNNIVDIDDLIKFVLLLCNSEKGDPGEIFLLGNTEKVQLMKVISYMKALCDSSAQIHSINTNEERYFTLDVSKAVKYGYTSKKIEDIIMSLYQLQ